MSGARDHPDTVYSVTVRRENGDQRLLALCRTEEEFRGFTVLELKSRVAQAFTGVADVYQGSDPIRSICLVFADKQLKDEHTLSFYGIKHQDTVHVTWVVLAVAESGWNDDDVVLNGAYWDYGGSVVLDKNQCASKDKGKSWSMEHLCDL